MALETIADGEYAKIPMGCYPCAFVGRTAFTSKKATNCIVGNSLEYRTP